MPERRPHIILIMTDQQRYDTIAGLGFPYMTTPHLDRLIREGITFRNCFVSAASCVPTRASLFTGCYPHTTGIYSNNSSWSDTWAQNLADAGYYCVNIGKMHIVPPELPAGFHERYVVENKDRQDPYTDRWDMALRARGLEKPGRRFYRQLPDYKQRLGAFEWPVAEDMHPDFFVGDMATWWIRSRPKVERLFLQIGFPGPHPPYDPVERYAKPYMEREIPVPEVSQEELDAQPVALRNMRVHNAMVDHDSVAWRLNPTREQLRRERAYYLANVTMIDEKVGEILAALDEKGYLDDAVVVFTSDHGDCLGDHGHSQKWSMYDIITRVPTIVWAPGRFGRGRTVDALVQQMDLAPALLELADAEQPQPCDARSVLPLLRGEGPDELRDYVFAQQTGDGHRPDAEMQTMIRGRDWKLVHYLGRDDGELYDLRRDPEEVRNLWSDAEHHEKREELIRLLLEWMLRTNRERASWRHDKADPFGFVYQHRVVEEAVSTLDDD